VLQNDQELHTAVGCSVLKLQDVKQMSGTAFEDLVCISGSGSPTSSQPKLGLVVGCRIIHRDTALFKQTIGLGTASTQLLDVDIAQLSRSQQRNYAGNGLHHMPSFSTSGDLRHSAVFQADVGIGSIPPPPASLRSQALPTPQAPCIERLVLADVAFDHLHSEWNPDSVATLWAFYSRLSRSEPVPTPVNAGDVPSPEQPISAAASAEASPRATAALGCGFTNACTKLALRLHGHTLSMSLNKELIARKLVVVTLSRPLIEYDRVTYRWADVPSSYGNASMSHDPLQSAALPLSSFAASASFSDVSLTDLTSSFPLSPQSAVGVSTHVTHADAKSASHPQPCSERLVISRDCQYPWCTSAGSR